MALTTPKMSLSVWNHQGDPYDHAQLADNWSKVDFHDHTPGRGVQIPTEGIADYAVTAIKLSSAIDPSQGYMTYKDVHRAKGTVESAAPQASTYLLSSSGSRSIAAVGTTAWTRDHLFYLDPADYNVTGRSTVLRGRAYIVNNATAPTTNFTLGLYPVTTVGGLTTVETSISAIGSVVTGSTAAFVAPAASSATPAVVSGDFAFPTAGLYAIGVVNSGASAAASRPTFFYDLQVRQV